MSYIAALCVFRSFDTKAGEWQTIRLPFDDFTPVFRAKVVRDAPKFNTSQVASVQLMLSKFEYDGALNPAFKAGVFELPIAEMKAYMAEPVTARCVLQLCCAVTQCAWCVHVFVGSWKGCAQGCMHQLGIVSGTPLQCLLHLSSGTAVWQCIRPVLHGYYSLTHLACCWAAYHVAANITCLPLAWSQKLNL